MMSISESASGSRGMVREGYTFPFLCKCVSKVWVASRNVDVLDTIRCHVGGIDENR